MSAGRVARGALAALAVLALLLMGCGGEPPPPAAAPSDDAAVGPLRLAELHVRAAEAGERDRALRALELLDAIPESEPRRELLRARALLVRAPQDLPGASRAIVAARDRGLDAVELDQLEGLVAIAKGDVERARSLLAPTLGQGPRRGWVALSWGQLELERGELPRAVQLLRRAVSELPGEAEAAFLLAQASSKAGDVETQLWALDEALRRDPAHAGARLQRSAFHGLDGRDARVDADIHALLVRDDELSRRDSGDPVARAERKQLADRSRELEPEVAEWPLRLARAEADGGDCDGAVALLEESRPILRDTRELALAAEIARGCGELELGRVLAEAAIATEEPTAERWRVLALGSGGAAALGLGEPLQAEALLRQAVQAAPYLPEWRGLLAQALQALGREDQAAAEAELARRLGAATGAGDQARQAELAAWIAEGPLAPLELAELLVQAAEDGRRAAAARARALLEDRSRTDGRAALLLARARLAEENQDFGRAREDLDRAIRLGVEDRVTVEQLEGLIAHSIGERETALRYLRSAREGGPSDAQAALALGEMALEEGRAQEAAELLQRASSLAPTAAEPAFLLARAEELRGNREAQLAALDRALEREPDHFGARLARGRLRSTAGAATDLTVHRLLTRDHDLSRRPGQDRRAALERLQLAEELVGTEPLVPFWRARWADMLVQQGRMASAVSVLRDSRRIRASRLVTGWCARLAYQAGDAELAERFARVGLGLPEDPPLPPALECRLHSTLGACLLRKGEPSEALAPLRRAVELVPHQADLHALLALAYEQTGASTDAIAEYRTALQLDPDNLRTLSNLGALLREGRRPREALLLLEAACRIAPEDAAAQANRGMALADLGRVQEALAALETASRLDPARLEIAWALGAALVTAGRPEDARPQLERAATDPRFGEQALSLLESIPR